MSEINKCLPCHVSPQQNNASNSNGIRITSQQGFNYIQVPSKSNDLGTLGLIENNRPTKDVETLMTNKFGTNWKADGRYKVIVSEHLAYGLLNAVKSGNTKQFTELFNAIEYLSQQYNNRETNTSSQLLPWLTIMDTKGTTIPKTYADMRKSGNIFVSAEKDSDPLYGNTSASDADLDLLVALVMSIQPSFNVSGKVKERVENLIHKYAAQFNKHIAQPILVKNGDHMQTHLIYKSGALISPGSQKLDPKNPNSESINTYRFHPSYINFRYLNILERYFNNGKDYNPNQYVPASQHSASYAQLFYMLRKSSETIINALLKKYPDVKSFPEAVDIGFDRTGKIHIFETEMGPSTADQSRLLARIGTNIDGKQDRRFASFNSCMLPKDGASFSSLYCLIEDFPKTRPTLSATYKVDDYAPGTKLKKPVEMMLNETQKHFRGKTPVSDIPERSYPVASKTKLPDLSPLANSSLSERQLKSAMELALDIFNDNNNVDLADQIYRDNLSLLIGTGRTNTSIIKAFDKAIGLLDSVCEATIGDGLITASLSKYRNQDLRIELISRYIQQLRVMKGFSDKDISTTISMLIASANRIVDPTKQKATILPLLLEKALLWNEITAEEQTDLIDLAKKYNDSTLNNVLDLIKRGRGLTYALHETTQMMSSRYKDPGADYRYTAFKINITSQGKAVLLDSSDPKLTLYTLARVHMSSNLRMLLQREIVKRDLQAIFEKFPPKTTELKTALCAYLEKEGQHFEVFRNLILTNIIYTRRLSYEDRISVIKSELKKLPDLDKASKADSKKPLVERAIGLVQAYQVIQFQKHSDNVTLMQANKSVDMKQWSKIIREFQSISNFFVQGKPLPGTNGVLSEMTKKISPDLFSRSSGSELHAMAIMQTLDLSYWLYYHINVTLKLNDAGKELKDLATQSKALIPKGLKDYAETYHKTLPKHHLYHSLIIRMELEDIRASIANGKRPDPSTRGYTALNTAIDSLLVDAERDKKHYAIAVLSLTKLVLQSLSGRQVDLYNDKIKPDLKRNAVFKIHGVDGEFFYQYVLDVLVSQANTLINKK